MKRFVHLSARDHLHAFLLIIFRIREKIISNNEIYIESSCTASPVMTEGDLRRKIFIILRQTKSSREIDLLCISDVIMSHTILKNVWQNEDNLFFKIRRFQNRSSPEFKSPHFPYYTKISFVTRQQAISTDSRTAILLTVESRYPSRRPHCLISSLTPPTKRDIIIYRKRGADIGSRIAAFYGLHVLTIR